MSAQLRPEDRFIRALEALRFVEKDYGLKGLRKPCVALLLDGEIGAAHRHEAAFIIAIECREIGLSEQETERVLTRWAKKIDYPPYKAIRAIKNAYAKRPNGGYRYYAPGLVKPPTTVAFRVLASTCEEVGCPSNCPAFLGLRPGPHNESFRHFERLRWPQVLRRERHAAAIDWYQALCLLEEERGFSAGSPLKTSTRQLAALAGRDRRHAFENLELLHARNLLANLERGSGSGEFAHDRRATDVARQIPIPAPPVELLGQQYKTGRPSPPWIRGQPPSPLRNGQHPNIGGEP